MKKIRYYIVILSVCGGFSFAQNPPDPNSDPNYILQAANIDPNIPFIKEEIEKLDLDLSPTKRKNAIKDIEKETLYIL